MRFRLRESKPDDFDRLYEIDQQCFPPGISYSRRELAYYMKLRGVFTVVAEPESKRPEVAGFVVAQKHAKGFGHIITIDTLPEFRRHGLGTTLMNAAEHRLRTGGCYGMVLETAVDNLAAIAFYKRLGYFVLKTIPRYYQGRLDALMMVKRFEKVRAADE